MFSESSSQGEPKHARVQKLTALIEMCDDSKLAFGYDENGDYNRNLQILMNQFSKYKSPG
jgi:hypothetical protein